MSEGEGLRSERAGTRANINLEERIVVVVVVVVLLFCTVIHVLLLAFIGLVVFGPIVVIVGLVVLLVVLFVRWLLYKALACGLRINRDRVSPRAGKQMGEMRILKKKKSMGGVVGGGGPGR
jgi:membrane protein YdbS with pleckstrin-like domain